MPHPAAYVAAVFVSAPYAYHLAHGSRAFLGLLEDDYFYYAIIADKLVTLGKLTYDGVTLTNGFHPLWFLVIWFLRLVCGRFGTAFYLGLTGVTFAAMIATYELGRRFARALGAPPALAPAVAAVYCLGTDRLFSMGMEATIAVPLFLWFLIEAASEQALTPRRAAKLGFLASLAILGRLDISLAVAMLLVGWAVFARPSFATVRRLAPAFCAAGILVPIYAAANFAIFGAVMPVSALAKRLTVAPGLDLSYLSFAAFKTVFGVTVGLVVPLGALALLLAWRRTRGSSHARPAALLVGAVVLAFAAAFYGAQRDGRLDLLRVVRVPARARDRRRAGLRVRRGGPPRARRARAHGGRRGSSWRSCPRGPFTTSTSTGRGGRSPTTRSSSASFNLADRHARSARGSTRWAPSRGPPRTLLDKPVVQIEGLVADRAMVEHVRHQDRLDEVLEGVRRRLPGRLLLGQPGLRAPAHARRLLPRRRAEQALGGHALGPDARRDLLGAGGPLRHAEGAERVVALPGHRDAGVRRAPRHVPGAPGAAAREQTRL